MTNKHKHGKRFIAMLLTLSMLLSLLPAASFATGESTPPETTTPQANMTLEYTDEQGKQTIPFDGTSLVPVRTTIDEKGIKEATLKLNADISNCTAGMQVPDGVKLTLDLNGYDFDFTGSKGTITVSQSANVIITDNSVGDKKGSFGANANAVNFNSTSNKGTLTVENGVTVGTIKAKYADVTMNGVHVKGRIQISGYGLNDSPIFSMTDCTLDNSDQFNSAFQVDGKGNITLDNCTMTSDTKPVFKASKDADMTVKSGTYTCTNGDVIATNSSMKIEGGTFISKAGGQFNKAFEGCQLSYPAGKKLAYQNDKWELAQLTIVDNGALQVTPKEGSVTNPTSVQAAFEAVQANGGTIQLTGDSSLTGNSGLVVNKDVTLDLNGHKLTLAPDLQMNNEKAGAINVIQGGSLTIKDETGKGQLDVSGTSYGITLTDSKANFTLNGGTIVGSAQKSTAVTINYPMTKLFKGSFSIAGGKITTSNGYAIQAIGDFGNNPIVMLAGEIICQGGAVGIASHIPVNIKGTAKITSESSPALKLGVDSSNISEKAVISSSADNTIAVEGAPLTVKGESQVKNGGNGSVISVAKDAFGYDGTLTVEGNAKLESAGKSVIAGAEGSGINLNGGQYKLGENTLFIEKCSDKNITVNYKHDDSYTGDKTNLGFYILATDPDENGYRGLMKRQDVKQQNLKGEEEDYQNFEKLDSALTAAEKMISNEGAGDNAFTEPTKQAVLDAQALAKRYVNNPSTSQLEINVLAAMVNKAVAGLQTIGNVDPSTLTDGVYTVNVNALMSGKDDASASAGALEPKATLIVKNGKKELHVGYQPLHLFGLNGHLCRLWYYDGASAKESLKFARSSEWEKHIKRCEVTEYYTVNEQDPLKKVPVGFDPTYDYDGEGVLPGVSHFPGSLVIPLNYVSAVKGEDRYVCRVSVDAMNSAAQINEQDLDIQVLWGTAKAVEKGDDALFLSKNDVSLKVGASETVTAGLVSGTALSPEWKSGNENVATVDNNGKITAVAEGNTKIAVVANVLDKKYTRVINVTVGNKTDENEGGNGEGGGTQPPVVPSEPSIDQNNSVALKMMHEYQNQPSMCNNFFEERAGLQDNGDGTVTMTMKIVCPVPTFPDTERTGVVENMFITYDGEDYPVSCSQGPASTMMSKADYPPYGITGGKTYKAQVLTVDLPRKALDQEYLVTTSDVIPVQEPGSPTGHGMVFRMFLSDLQLEEATPEGPVPGIVENEDGSKTETVVKPDGTITETTTGKPDGSTIEKVTKPDGTESEKTTQKDGTYEQKTTTPDGTITEQSLDKEGTIVDKTTKKDGLTTETTTTKAGKVTAEVTIPDGQKNVVVNIPKKDLKPGEVAVIVKEDGSREVIKKSVAGKDGLSLVLDESTKLEIIDNSKDFNDVSDKHWGNKAVDFVASREIFNGTAEKTFAPDATMTRGMLVQVLYNFENRPEGSKNADFGDVKDDAWFADAVAWAADNKIVAGVGENNFAPEQEISREQLVTILYRYAGSPKVEGSLDKYGDAANVSSYAQDAMLWAVENGIVSGMGNNTLAPQGDATRAQVAQIMMNFCDVIVK